jgi:hypothetical protein
MEKERKIIEKSCPHPMHTSMFTNHTLLLLLLTIRAAKTTPAAASSSSCLF